MKRKKLEIIKPVKDLPSTNINEEKSIQHKPSLRETWLTKHDVMELMQISERTLQNWRSKGILPYSKIHGKLYYSESDIQQMLHKGKEE
jgi:transcriptional antiterminator